MRQPQVDDHVHVIKDIPELALHRGDVGVVRSIWFAPADAYEVEFIASNSNCPSRGLLFSAQIEIEELPAQGPLSAAN